MKDRLMNGLLQFATALNNQRHMSAVKHAFASFLPIIIAGSLCTLVVNVVTSTTTTGVSLAKVDGFAWLENLSPMFEAANYATMNFMTIYIVFLIALELGRHYNRTEFILPLVAVASYVSLAMTSVTVENEGVITTVTNVLPREYTNAQGLFLGIITSIVATELYVKIVKSGKLAIHMPESVPSNVAKSFNVLFPSILVIFTISGINLLMTAITGMTLSELVYTLIQTPFKNILTGLPGYLVLITMTHTLWIFGIHGTQAMKAIYEPVTLAAIAENTERVAQGLEPLNIINASFMQTFATGTGAGITGGLIAAIMIFSKRKEYKEVGKLSIPLAMFNINESVTFGLPIVLNPILALPFILAPLLSSTIGYFMTVVGIAQPMSYFVPWTTPPLLKSFLATGGHMGTVMTEAIAISASVLVYIPFVLVTNKQAQKAEEAEAAAAEEAKAKKSAQSAPAMQTAQTAKVAKAEQTQKV